MAAIAGPHGVRGLVRLKSFAEIPEDCAAYGPLLGADGTRWRVEIVGRAKGALIARLDGVGDRGAVERMKGMRLYLARDQLPPPEEDVFYHTDLIGLRVERGDGVSVGTVLAVHNFGAGDLLEIENGPGAGESAGKSGTVLIPFNRETVPLVDIAGGRLVIDPMDGLLDEEETPKPHAPRRRKPSGQMLHKKPEKKPGEGTDKP